MKSALLFALILALSYCEHLGAGTPLDDALNPSRKGDFNIHGGVRLGLEKPLCREFVKGPEFPPIWLLYYQEAFLNHFSENGINLTIHITQAKIRR